VVDGGCYVGESCTAGSHKAEGRGHTLGYFSRRNLDLMSGGAWKKKIGQRKNVVAQGLFCATSAGGRPKGGGIRSTK